MTIVAGIQGVLTDVDDVLVSGKNQKEHDEGLKIVLDKMRAANVTLNDKCEFSVKKVKFLGHIITAEGVSIDPDKVEAIVSMKVPEDVPGLRRLGMVNHVGKFVPMLADVTKPLRELLKRENEWF